MAAVKTGTSGCTRWNAARPSGQVSRHTKRIERGRVARRRRTAAIAELPVASMGSSTTTSRSVISGGTLK
jgi:hypothetical protein